MADHHYTFQVVAPALTQPSAPVEVMTVFDPGAVEGIEIRWPSGHSSLTGIRIAVAHQTVIPRNVGGWILGESMQRQYTPHNMPNSGQWSVFVYNTDNRAHYWQITYAVLELHIPTRNRRKPIGPLPVSAIYAIRDSERLPQ